MRLVRPRSVPAPAAAGPGATLGSYGVPSGFSTTSVPGTLPSGWSAGDPASQYYITADNVTVDGYDFTGPASLTKNTLTVQSTNVLIKRCRFTGDANRAIDTFGAGTVTIQDCTFIDNFDDAAVSGPNFIVDRCDFYGMGNDAIKMGDDSIVRNSYIHNFNTVVGGHGDGIQGVDTPHRIQITNCLIDIGLGGATGVLPNSAVIITPWTIVESGPGSISFDHCTFGGGGFTFHLDLGFTAGLSVTNCKILSDYDSGPIYNVDAGSPVPSPETWTGNVRANGTAIAWNATS